VKAISREVNPVYKIKIIAVGKIKEQYCRAGISEYKKRLAPFARIEFIEVKEAGGSSLNMHASLIAENLAREGEGIRRKIAPGEYIIALDRKGAAMSSEDFSKTIASLGEGGNPRISFLIGGSMGLDPGLLQEAHLTLSFSTLTFPHQLFRLLLMEQVYRAFCIMQGHPYHK
jgi:23S rRNA (pseudouridine1915-N3)-methyltransferase